MTQHNERNRPSEAGLLAFGSSRRWDVSVDESPEGDWSLELDGPQAYLVFQLRGLEVVPQMRKYLESAAAGREQGAPDGLLLGRFGSARVSLLRDNEDFPRFFLVVGPTEKSAVRLTLEEADIGMIREALSQVIAELPELAGE